MSAVLCTLVLNEMEWLPKLYEQHRRWKDIKKWIFVEAADFMYAEANPNLVTDKGLSVDGTTEFLMQLARQDKNVLYIPYGISTSANKAAGKCAARQAYLNVCEDLKPDFIYVLDADEFYTYNHQTMLNVLTARGSNARYTSFILRQRSIWHPPGARDVPLFTHEVVGGFWDIKHCHIFRWTPGLKYTDSHNHPNVDMRRAADFSTRRDAPYFIHMACAADVDIRHAKNAYYAIRGEADDPRRKKYVESRAAFETWQPGVQLPGDAKVIRYTGEIPEVFK